MALKYLSVFILGISLLGCKSKHNYLQAKEPVWYSNTISSQPNTQNTKELVAVSFNIQYAQELDSAIGLLQKPPMNDADILLLQEMDEKGVDYIAKALNYNYVYYPIIYNTHYKQNFGNAVLSKWPIQYHEKIIFPHTKAFNGHRRGATYAQIQYQNVVLHVYSIHLETMMMKRSKRIEQLKSALAHVNNLAANSYIILGGDFNSIYNEDIRQMTTLCANQDLHWSSKNTGHTTSKLRGILRPQIDHIFSRGFEVKNVGKEPDQEASDHFPIWVGLQFLP